MKLKHYLSLFVIFVFIACNKKEYPKDTIENNEALFYTALQVNGSPVKLEAGKNGYYMYSSYAQDSNGVYSFSGELSNSSSGAATPNSIRISIKDSKTSSLNAPSNINSSLVPGSYNYFESGYTTSYGVEFESTYNRSAKNYFWDFGDGTSSKEANPVHYYKQKGSFTSCLTIDGANTCRSTICNEITSGSNSFNAYITAIIQTNNTVNFTCHTLNGRASYSYFWTFGDGSFSQSASPSHVYAITGGYPVTLKVIDADGKFKTLSYNVVTGQDLSSCATNYKIKSILPDKSNLGLSEVLIHYTDANGITYSSELAAQDKNSTCNILSVEDFEINEKGEKTKKISLNFKCKLFSGTKAIDVESSDCVICVAYK